MANNGDMLFLIRLPNSKVHSKIHEVLFVYVCWSDYRSYFGGRIVKRRRQSRPPGCLNRNKIFFAVFDQSKAKIFKERP